MPVCIWQTGGIMQGIGSLMTETVHACLAFALRGLIWLADERAMPTLIRLLTLADYLMHRDERVRAGIVAALVKIGDASSAGKLAAALNDIFLRVRFLRVRASAAVRG
jgi:HEAT repeat protein